MVVDDPAVRQAAANNKVMSAKARILLIHKPHYSPNAGVSFLTAAVTSVSTGLPGPATSIRRFARA